MKIMVAYDGSDASDRALHMAFRMGKAMAAEITILTVLEPMAHLTYQEMLSDSAWLFWEGGDPAALEAFLREQHEEIARLIQLRAAEAVASYEYPYERIVDHGPAREQICSQAKAHGADLLVIGSRGLGPIKRMLMGSVSDYVVRHGPCSVLVARPGEPQAS